MAVEIKLALQQVDPAKRTPSADGKWIVGWWQSYRRERHDEDVTEWTAAVFDAGTAEPVQYVYRRYVWDYRFSEGTGSPMTSAKLDDECEFILINGGEQADDRVPFKRPTPTPEDHDP